ncbi:hypothetical protein PybrP1_006172 [[Pythium] brassicae (nom. inval.)]|nr:hypothetical protein PybrP1_006172 [[Pythium] brassicae (nom. inval.)]
MTLFRGLVRGYRRLAARVLPRSSCPICLDDLPALGLGEEAQSADAEPTFAKLSCKHKFCGACIRQYMVLKIQAKEVDDDQLVCPELQCKRRVAERDIEAVCGAALLLLFQSTLKRKRDERNPSARWCPRPGCEELIVCESAADFTCPACGARGCFQCRGYAHRFWFCRAKKEDASYLEWEKSVGERHAVRPCPQCKMRIWKADGCNHIKCAGCRFEFCWVCGAPWEPRHYACHELPSMFSGPLTFQDQLLRVLLLVAMVYTAGFVAVFGFGGLFTLFMVVSVGVDAAQDVHRRVQQYTQQLRHPLGRQPGRVIG